MDIVFKTLKRVSVDTRVVAVGPPLEARKAIGINYFYLINK